MERTRWSFCVAAVLALAAVGCTGPSASQDGGASATGPGPEKIVFDFLSAVKEGDEEKAALMLTADARKKTAEHDLVVSPPGSGTATFEVGKVEIVDEGGAHVASKWTDVDENNQPHSDEIIWMLRQDPEGWRIAGMATKLFEDELPLLLNFEDPEDMIRKQKLAEEEIQRRANGGAQEAKAPAGGDPQQRSAARQPSAGESLKK